MPQYCCRHASRTVNTASVVMEACTSGGTDSYSGVMTRISAASPYFFFSARGREPMTSPSPPVAAKGMTSAPTNSTFLGATGSCGAGSAGAGSTGVGSAAAVPGAVSTVRAGSSCTGTGFFFRGARGFLGAGVPSVCAAGAAISAGSAGAVGAGFAFLAVFLAAGLRPGFFSVWAGDFSASVTSFFSSSMVGCGSFLRPTGGPGGINTVWGGCFGGKGGLAFLVAGKLCL